VLQKLLSHHRFFVATNFRGNVRFSNPCVEENEDQSRRLARGWSMVWLSSRVTGCHTWGESYEHLLKMLEEAHSRLALKSSERESSRQQS